MGSKIFFELVQGFGAKKQRLHPWLYANAPIRGLRRSPTMRWLRRKLIVHSAVDSTIEWKTEAERNRLE
jgi:hypothetical protein